jgi:hypothetical protein
VTVAIVLEGGKQPVEFVLGQRLAFAAIGLASDFPLYSLIGRLETMHGYWLSTSFYHSTFYIVT